MRPDRGLSRGLWTGAPALHLMLALVPALAMSTSLRSGPGLGVAAVLALIGFGLLLAAARGLVPGRLAASTGLAAAIAAAIVAGLLLVRRSPGAEGLVTYLPAVVISRPLLGRVEALAAALGFVLAVALLAGMKERLDLAPLPRQFEGAPVSLISAGLISMAFMGFSGMIGL